MKPADYPKFLTGLPEADLPVHGLRGWMLQGSSALALFLHAGKDVILPPHAHGDQWGIVIDGKMDLTVATQTKTYQQGDSYFMPAGVEHHGKLYSGFRAIDCFADPDRYKPRE
jgi:mannose-6-phosphate isomerase-like protein (cupin superfamily)